MMGGEGTTGNGGGGGGTTGDVHMHGVHEQISIAHEHKAMICKRVAITL